MVTKPLWPNGRFGVPQITPYTARDGHTLLELIKALRDHVVEQLHPNLQNTIDQLVADVEAEYDTAHNRYVDGVQEFQRIHDAFMSDVNASLIALNDGAVTDLVNDDTSMLGKVLREIFPNREAFTQLEQQNELHRDHLTRTVDDFKDQATQEIATLANDVDQRLDDFSDRIEDLRDALEMQLIPELSGALGGGRATIVMVGSSTTTRNEYPAEIARLVHTEFHPGVFRTLRRSSWAEPESELKWSTLPPGAHVINAGWGGSAGADYVDQSIATEINALNPTVVMHAIGANDWYHGRNPQNLVSQIQQVINMLHSTRPMWHVLVHQHERQNVPSTVPYTWDDYLDALHQVAAQNDNVIVIDAASKMRKLGVGVGLSDPYQLMDDNTHLNTAGHRILGRIVGKELGFAGVSGAMDTGWLPVTRDSEHIRLQPGGETSDNEPLMYRVTGDGSGYTVHLRGIVTRNTTSGARVSFAEITGLWRNALVPKVVYAPHDRHRIGLWNTVASDRFSGGPVYIRQSGALHAANHHNDMGSVGFFVDAIIRA